MFWGSVGPWAWLGWLGWLEDPKNPKLRGGSGQVKKLHSCDVHFEALGQIWAGTQNRGLGPEASWGVLGPLGASWGLLGCPGASWGVLGRPGVSWGVLGRPVQIHKLGPRPQVVRLPLRSVAFGGAAPGGTSSVVERTTWG